MGWTETHATFYKNGKVDRKAECDAICTYTNEKVTSRVLKSAMVSTVYYAAVEQIREGVREVFAAVFLTSGSLCGYPYFNFSYKDMSEDWCPCEQDCPVSILKLLTPTDSEYANEWRQKCYENAEKKKAARKDPHNINNLAVGTRIRFTAYNGKLYEIVKMAPSYQFKRAWWYMPDENKYIPAKRIPKDFEIVKEATA